MFKTIFATTAATLIALAVAVPAQAGQSCNGTKLNGTKLNGSFVNGFGFNGFGWNGVQPSASEAGSGFSVIGIELPLATK